MMKRYTKNETDKLAEIPNYVTNGLATIAVRMATSKALENLIRKTE